MTLSALRRPALVTVLAILHLVGATLCLLVALFAFGALVVSDPEEAGTAVIGGLLLGGIGAVQLFCGIGLLKLKPYGRTLQLVFAWIGLIGVPIGTIVSILILVYFFKPGIKVLFAGKSTTELTAEELAQAFAISQGSLATVIVVLLVALLSIAGVGIIAAIAIPGLLRARISGNEASAIGALRQINSAQKIFAANCGDGFYALSLKSLATPPEGQQIGFVTTDLALDPSVKNGYTITLGSGDATPSGRRACNGATVVMTYFATAEPITLGATGTRFFGTNQTGEIYESTSPIAVTRGGALEGASPLR